MAAPMLYHRAPAFVEVYERVLTSSRGLPDRQRRADLRGQRLRRDGLGGRQPDPPRHQGARRRGGQVRRALDRAGARPTRPTPSATSPAGASALTRASSTVCCGERRHRDRLRHAERDLDRHRQRHPGDRRGRQPPRRILAVDAVSGLGAAELKQDEWGVDVVVAGSQKALMIPPGLAFASRLPEGAGLRRGAAGRPLLLRLGQDRQVAAQGQLAVHAGGLALPGARRRARPDRGGGPGQRLRPPRAARPRHPRRRRRARPRAVRRPGRALHRRDRDRAARATSTAARSPARCASSGSPPTAARTT